MLVLCGSDFALVLFANGVAVNARDTILVSESY